MTMAGPILRHYSCMCSGKNINSL